jgi:CrcB protein
VRIFDECGLALALNCNERGAPVAAMRRGIMAIQRYLLIAMGGALGSVARYWLGSSIARRVGTKIPYGTFAINMLACFLIGFSVTLIARRAGLNSAWRFLIPVGFVGAFSTFSTYEWETLSTIRSGAFMLAAVYALGSFVLGFAAVWCGTLIAETL